MASKLLTLFNWAAISTNVTKKKQTIIILSLQTSTSFAQMESSINWERVQYRNPVLQSVTYLCFRHWPIRNEIFCWVYYNKKLLSNYKRSFPRLSAGTENSKKLVLLIKNTMNDCNEIAGTRPDRRAPLIAYHFSDHVQPPPRSPQLAKIRSAKHKVLQN